MKKEVFKMIFIYAVGFMTGYWLCNRVKTEVETGVIHIKDIDDSEPMDPGEYESPCEDSDEQKESKSILQKAHDWETVSEEYFNEMSDLFINYLEFRYSPTSKIYEEPYGGHYKHIYGREDFNWLDNDNTSKWAYADKLGALIVADMIHTNQSIKDGDCLYAKFEDEQMIIKVEICSTEGVWDYDEISDSEANDIFTSIRKDHNYNRRQLRGMFDYIHMIDEKDFEESIKDPNIYSPLTMRYYKDGTIICEEDGPNNDVFQNVKVLGDAIGWIPDEPEDGFTIYVRNEALMEDIKLIYVDENGFELLP